MARIHEKKERSSENEPKKHGRSGRMPNPSAPSQAEGDRQTVEEDLRQKKAG